jgi:hypothetical protein
MLDFNGNIDQIFNNLICHPNDYKIETTENDYL